MARRLLLVFLALSIFFAFASAARYTNKLEEEEDEVEDEEIDEEEEDEEDQEDEDEEEDEDEVDESEEEEDDENAKLMKMFAEMMKKLSEKNKKNKKGDRKRLTCKSKPCFKGVKCRDTNHGVKCGKCPTGYLGDGIECTKKITCRDKPCFKGVYCIDTSTGFKCGPCPKGHTGNGKDCTRTSGCEFDPCFAGVACQEKKKYPFYKCGLCPNGYAGNGKNCEDVDECAEGEPCDPKVTCNNMSPGYECGACPAGFEGSDGFSGIGLEDAQNLRENCTDIDECVDGNNGGCTENSECTNMEGTFFCGSCIEGYVGSQTIGCKIIPGYCTDGKECDPQATCLFQQGFGTNICKCQVGWAGNGHICGADGDLDGWPDNDLGCAEKQCRKDNCQKTPNAGQEDEDNDGVGDSCDNDSDNDGYANNADNCPLSANPDQKDSDGDKRGDACDNCPSVANSAQEDADKDGIGDVCDNDIDNDGVPNDSDNCRNKANADQLDEDGDGVGNACDNCPDVSNPNQVDADMDFVGDACDNNVDLDKDGIQDNIDNCPSIPNSDQLDTDGDGQGDICDEDIDGDGILNEKDNCPLAKNPAQEDVDKSGVGDICQDDFDVDSIPNYLDNCPNNSQIFKTDFRSYQTVALDPVGTSQQDPNWVILKEGAEILQTLNSDPGLAVGFDKFGGVDFEGTIYVGDESDDDFIGFVFSYQDNHKFYAVVWKKGAQNYWEERPFKAIGEPAIQLKLINSNTGPGEMLRNALWHAGDTPNEVKLLWKDHRNQGWQSKVAYRWKLVHRPNIGLIRLKVFNGPQLVADSGNIYDNTLQGGRIGVYCFSQEMIYWSDLIYNCNDDVTAEIYNSLPSHLQAAVTVAR